jgi:thiol-disulfide isomerase/thioredoxin
MQRQPLTALFFSLVLSTDLYAENAATPAPVCELKVLPGNTAYSLQQLRGKVLYVDFWASWCGSCVKSFPYLNTLQQSFKDKGLQVIAINVDEKPEEAQHFLAQHPTEFMVVADATQQCATQFAVEGMPSTYLIDKKGMIRYRHVGFRSGETKDVEQKLAQLLAE